MSLSEQITLIFLIIFLFVITLLSFFASKKDRCYEAEEFDSEYVTIESNPIKDGVTGYYPNQKAEWHDTGLRSNGDPFIIQVSGAWTPWYADQMTDAKLAALERCKFCAKRDDGSAPNCICEPKQSPADEENQTCNSSNSSSDQDNPNLCTCTTKHGNSTDYGNYFFPLNYFDKDKNLLTADNQTACKYDRGIGAYIGLFGSNGVTDPVRLYHLYSTETLCNITADSDGACKDADGVDQTRYVFRSANNRIFMKDDFGGNNGTDTNTSDDTYHKTNEVVKLKIYDEYYSDNYGRYYINIIKGVGDSSDASKAGLLEFMARLVENSLLGEANRVTYDDGTSETIRSGGIIEFMYKAIVQDSGFILLLQVILSLYVTFYGFAVLMGIAEISKKELTQRVLKISLVILFTSNSSWHIYNQIVVGFFYDSMNYVVATLMDLSDQTISTQDSTLILNAQMERAVSTSNATRFSYIDSLITLLMSESASAKIFGLFFGAPFFGFFYIPIIYLLIAFFIYVMLTAALVYCINIMKIIFVLCLGPIFMCFLLFSHTNQMFKNWIAFLGARSLEIVIMFFVLYSFVTILYVHFTDLLYYRACVHSYKVGLISIKVLKSDVGSRTFLDWMTSFFVIFGLTFMTKLVLEKIPELSGKLIKIGGVENISQTGARGASGAEMASGIMSWARGLGQKAALTGLGGFGVSVRGAMGIGTGIARKTGVADTVAKLTSSIPITSPRGMIRNTAIDSAISKAKKDANAKGLTGAAADSHIRKTAFASLQNRLDGKSQDGLLFGQTALGLAGLDLKTISQRMDKKLIEDPLKEFIKQESKRLKNLDPEKVPLGKDMRAALISEAQGWASTNLSAGKQDVEKYLNKLGKEDFDLNKASRFERGLSMLIDDKGKLSASEAAKKFVKNPEMQKKYMQDLQNREFERNKKNEDARKYNSTWVANIGGRAVDALNPYSYHDRNISAAEASFVRQIGNKEKRQDAGLSSRTEDARKEALKTYLKEAAEARIDNVTPLTKPQEEKENQKRAFLQNQLYKAAVTNKNFKDSLKVIRQLEADEKSPESIDKKRELLETIINDLSKNNGESLFEKTAPLSFLCHQLGLEGKDPQVALLEIIDAKISEELKKPTTAAELKDKIKEIEPLRLGLSSSETDQPIFEEIANTMKERMEEAVSADFAIAENTGAGRLIKGALDPDIVSSNKYKEFTAETHEEVRNNEDNINNKFSELEKTSKSCEEINSEVTALEKLAADPAKKDEVNIELETILSKLEEIFEAAEKSITQKSVEIDEIFKKAEESDITYEEKNNLISEAKKDFAAQSFEVKFGSSISDILLAESDDALKSGGILLNNSNDPSITDPDKSRIKSKLSSDKSRFSAKAKIAKIELKFAEAELSRLDNLPTKSALDNKRIAELQREIGELSANAREYDREVEKVENELEVL